MNRMSSDQRALLREQLTRVARFPSAADLWALRGTLLCMPGQPNEHLALETVRGFYLYLSELQSKMTARHYNELASHLDIASVGVLALQDILIEKERLMTSLLLGGVGEALMVLASRQYIKAWEQELRSVHRDATWTLYDVLWQLSQKHQPELDPAKRRALIEATLKPAMAADTPFEERMLLILRLFQVSLLILVAPWADPAIEKTTELDALGGPPDS
jgi:hypothetical protein